MIGSLSSHPRRRRLRRACLTGATSGAVALAMLASVSAACARPTTRPRAMWVWDAPAPAGLISWATSNKVKEIYLYTPLSALSGRGLAVLRDLHRRAGAARIRITALNGEPDWVFTPQQAVTWARAALQSGIFGGVHLDVEPHQLGSWYTDRSAAVAGYLSMIDALRSTVARSRATRTAAAAPMSLEVDVAFWYDRIPAAGGTFADQILRRVDGITVMSYRDRATGHRSIMEVGAPLLARATALGKYARLGAETHRDPAYPYVTFYEEGRRALARALDRVDTAAGGYAAYRGMAVHDHAGWTALRR